MALIIEPVFLLLTMIIGLAGGCKKGNIHSSDNKQAQNISIDLSAQSKEIKNIFSDVNCWNFRDDWTARALNQPSTYFRANYPFVKRIQFMTATGGSADRDLFIDPRNRSNLKDYRFTDLITALRQVVKEGLKPVIITGNVPLKYSVDPFIGSFGVNVRPPFDYDIYYNYIRALADTVVQEFGLSEVKTWSWGVLTEYENKDWFLVEDNTAESTSKAYFKLYDYTVAALQEAIGAANLYVGAHSMTVSEGLWDERKFIDHVAKGVNYKTGKTGTQINFLSTSFYDLRPGVPVPHSLTLAEAIALLRDRAEADGLTGLQYGIDEGRILNGPSDDSRPLVSRIVALGFQGASDARMFRTMTDLNADWFSTWGLSTEGVWDGVPSVGTHIARLGYKMVGENRVSMTVRGTPDDKTDEINGIASINNNLNTAHLMIYNYNSNIHATSSEAPAIIINHISPAVGKTVTIKQWMVDDTHGNFWPAWAADMRTRELTNKAFNWSEYSVEIPKNMLNQSDKDYWYSKESRYKSIAALDSTITRIPIVDNILTLKPTIAHHGVVFYEILNVKSTK
jgi:hypothetical protein